MSLSLDQWHKSQSHREPRGTQGHLQGGRTAPHGLMPEGPRPGHTGGLGGTHAQETLLHTRERQAWTGDFVRTDLADATCTHRMPRTCQGGRAPKMHPCNTADRAQRSEGQCGHRVLRQARGPDQQEPILQVPRVRRGTKVNASSRSGPSPTLICSFSS